MNLPSACLSGRQGRQGSVFTQPHIQQFIREHERDDPYQLALQAHRYPNYPIPAIVEQLQARQKAKHKLPEWHATEGLLFPPSLSMEQCSSQATAQFKQRLVQGQQLVDLTGGAGVDTYYLSQSFEQTDYVEQDPALATLAQHNFSVLGAHHVRTHTTSAEVFLQRMRDPADCIYLDPARRDDHNRKVFQLADSRPDVLALRDALLTKSSTVLLKTAPLLDIQAAVQALKKIVQVYIVAVNNEVKEVLYRMANDVPAEPEIIAVNLRGDVEEFFAFYRSQEDQSEASYADPLTYLYEPHAALMKAGAFKLIAQRFELYKLHPNTHLYTSDKLIPDFPGRTFWCQAVVPYQKKAVRQHLVQSKANITSRNFPDSVAAVRRKLGLKDGGDTYLFAARLSRGEPALIITQKAT